MQKNELYFKDDSIVRVLEVREDRVLVIDCIRRTMPQWKDIVSLAEWEKCSEEKICEITGVDLPEIDSLCPESRKVAYERYTMIAPILHLLPDEKKKCEMISVVADNEKVSKQTVRKYLCLYLVFQNVAILAPKDKENDTSLTKDEKNMRWALNKFYFSYEKHSLKTAYAFLVSVRSRMVHLINTSKSSSVTFLNFFLVIETEV